MELRNKKGHHKIAIVGTGALFPGALNSKDFWLNILAEKDFIRDVPESHWLKEDYFDPNDRSGDKVYCKKGGFLDDILFDPVEFGMPPNLLATTDTLQLLSLVAARDALADTISYQSGRMDPKKVSVILGVAGGTELIGQMSARIRRPEWTAAMRKQGLPEDQIQTICDDIANSYTQWNENTFPGLLGNVVSGRIANRFDLKGTNCVIDAACASSLGAIKMAVQELQLGTTDMVLTGGADALNDIFMYMCFSKTTALSPSEDCRPFSASGDGTVLGEGIAILAMKRLEDAERAGDRIYAVISAIGSSSDGRSKSIYAPDSNGQRLAIERAYEDAGFDVNELELVEGHGTGTIAGDFAEFNGLRFAYGESAGRQYCALGSIKSQIGHTKSAAGAASILKTALALENAVLPPTIKVDRPNEKLDIENSPFYLNTVARPWIHAPGSTRKAGVSSMGFGGTNFHVAMESYGEAAAPREYRAGRELILLGGADGADVLLRLEALLADLADSAFVAAARESQLSFAADASCRLAVLGEGPADIRKLLPVLQQKMAAGTKKFDIPNSAYYSEAAPVKKVAYLFSGQGSQYLNMGTDLVMQFASAMKPWNEAAALQLDDHRKLQQVVYPIPVFNESERETQRGLLVDTRWAQPAIGLLALSQLQLLNKLGLRPAMTGGHSYGEVAALYAAGVIGSADDLVRISRKRGELMAASAREPGTMTAVFTDSATVASILAGLQTRIVIANHNSPSQTVLSGRLAEMEAVEEALAKAGHRFRRLQVATAFHSELVAPGAAAFCAYLKEFKLGKASIPVYANTSAGIYPATLAAVRDTLAGQLAAPVRFEEQVRAMHAAGAELFLEIGPGTVLTSFVRDTLKNEAALAFSIDGGPKGHSKNAFFDAMGQLSVAGLPLQFAALWSEIAAPAPVATKKPSIASVAINGSNYGKPYPPKGGAAALPRANATRPPISVAPVREPAAPPAAPVISQATAVQAPKPYAAPPAAQSLQTNTNPLKKDNRIMSQHNSQWMQAFQEIQKNMLEAQKSFQDTMAQNHKLFLETSQLAFAQLGKLAGTVPAGDVATWTRSLPAEPAPALPAARIAGPVYAPQPAPAPVARPEAVAVQQPPVAAPAPVVTAPTKKEAPVDLSDMVLTIVSDKTGYPKEILDLETDLESGLGIDSIKRVEILSAIQEVFPTLKNVDTARLAAMNTLGEILRFAIPDGPAAPVTVVKAITIAAPLSEDFEDIMLQVVSDKTGYPKEILDLSMDLESGLGIDSIKRVEILSALQEKFPVLKAADTARLAAMNTLQQILDYASEASGAPTAAPVAEKKKPERAANVSRFVVERQAVADKHFGQGAWRSAQPFYIIPDAGGVADLLASMLKSVGIETRLVAAVPEGASHVLFLKGLDLFATEGAALAINREAFAAARTLGQRLFGGTGSFILAFRSHENTNTAAQVWCSGLSALAKTAALEWPGAGVRSINIHGEDLDASVIAERLFGTITSGGAAVELEIDHNGNYEQLITREAVVANKTRPLQAGDVVLVSGGAKGVTAACLQALTQRVPLRVAILGRTALDPEPAFLAGAQTDAALKSLIVTQLAAEGKKIKPVELNRMVENILGQREVQRSIRELEQSGAEVLYLAVDVSNESEVEAAAASVRARFGRINALVHAAGVLADKYIHEKTDAQFDRVFDTKVLGFINLLHATKMDALTHICCFSSVAARMGNNGQVDYAMANELLNKVCGQEQRQRGAACVVKSINWGPWDGGMVSPQLKKHFESMNVALIPLAEGAQIFANELEDADTQHVEIVVGGFLGGGLAGRRPQGRASLWLHERNAPFLASHVVQGRVVVPMMLVSEWCMRLAASLYPDDVITGTSELKVFKGIQPVHFNGSGDLYHFDYTRAVSSSGEELRIEVRDDSGTLYYGVTVHVGAAPAVGAPLPVPAYAEAWNWERDAIYPGKLFHGADFQVVAALDGISGDACHGRLSRIPAALRNSRGLSRMLIFDGGIQLAILAVAKWTGNTSSLPLGYSSLHLFANMPCSSEVSCELTRTRQGLMDSEWDVQFVNNKRELLAEIKGLRLYLYQAN
jgi:acyl transferase domain-containing protein/NAD(P)-dependent dehydrogenase (short-subunit alcohol dehydrogenase family)